MDSTDTTDATEDAELEPVELAMPMLYHHCVNVYRAMEKRAVKRTEGLLWEGYTTALWNELGLGIATYTSVTRRLMSMRCAKKLRRGGGNSPSQWLLLQPPTEDLYFSADDSKIPAQQRGRLQKANRDQQIRDLHRRLEKVENWARAQGAPI